MVLSCRRWASSSVGTQTPAREWRARGGQRRV